MTASDQLHQDRVEELIRGNRRMKQKAIAVASGISKERVGHIIGVFGFRKVYARWVPFMLSDEMKAERVRISREVLERFEKEGEDFLKKIITGDETWVHRYDPENKTHSTVYRHMESPQPKKIQNSGLGWKGHVDCFLEFGTCCSCRLPWKRNKNKLSTLHRSSYCIKKKNLTDWNKKCNTSSTRQRQASHKCRKKDAIQRLDFSVLPYPPYSPDLAPSDFHLFAKLKEHLKGQRFSCDEEVKSAVRKCFQKQNTSFLRTDLKN